jgi:hypothetical protein
VIGYPISLADLEELLREESPTWLDRAAARTEIFRTQGVYQESSSIWSEVKPMYMTLQGESKCAYCERKLESVEHGRGEQDVEHFRPKGNVRSWALPDGLEDQGIATTPVPDADSGYYLLPYHPFNYAASCKPCNSNLKGDRFPIAGDYDLAGDDPADLLQEQPYLIYPIGDFDEDPEDLIRFHGVSPQAVARSGHRRDRALVTIEFFRLDDVTARKNLVRERAVVIVALFPQLEKLADAGPGGAAPQAQQIVDGFASAESAHTNCARSFKRLFESDRAEAKAIFDRAVMLIVSIS